MIIDVKSILNTVSLKKKTIDMGPVEYNYELTRDNYGNYSGGLSPTSNPYNLFAVPKRGDSFLVGYIITIDNKRVLTSNGLFVNINQCKATDMLILPSYGEALLFTEELVINRGSDPNTKYVICAAYQHKNGENSVTCVIIDNK